jgi:hypothetical protein
MMKPFLLLLLFISCDICFGQDTISFKAKWDNKLNKNIELMQGMWYHDQDSKASLTITSVRLN